MPAKTSSNITPKGVDILSAQLIGHGLIISKKRKSAKADKNIYAKLIE
jgi:hypothetical protein